MRKRTKKEVSFTVSTTLTCGQLMSLISTGIPRQKIGSSDPSETPPKVSRIKVADTSRDRA